QEGGHRTCDSADGWHFGGSAVSKSSRGFHFQAASLATPQARTHGSDTRSDLRRRAPIPSIAHAAEPRSRPDRAGAMPAVLAEIHQSDILRMLAIAMFSLLVPVGVYVGRMNVRASRREIVRDLERLFQFAKVDGRPLILPSFELVKYKYDPDANPDRQNVDANANAIRYYIFPVAIYIILTFLCFNAAFKPGDGGFSQFSRPDGVGESLRGVIVY